MVRNRRGLRRRFHRGFGRRRRRNRGWSGGGIGHHRPRGYNDRVRNLNRRGRRRRRNRGRTHAGDVAVICDLHDLDEVPSRVNPGGLRFLERGALVLIWGLRSKEHFPRFLTTDPGDGNEFSHIRSVWLRVLDLNQRTSVYETDGMDQASPTRIQVRES